MVELLKYQEVVEIAKEEIKFRKPGDYKNSKIQLGSCRLWQDSDQINLWTYWQGYQLKDIDNKGVDILLVGQDWGNPFKEEGQSIRKRIKAIQENKMAKYIEEDEYASPTDKNLIWLFKDAFDVQIKELNPGKRLFFTNYSLGYRQEGTSETGNMTKTLLRKDSDLFDMLVNAINPTIIICLGKITYEVVVNKVAHDFVKHLNKGKPFEGIYHLSCRDRDVPVYGVAHCGARGFSNIGNDKAILDSWKYIAKKYEEINEFY